MHCHAEKKEEEEKEERGKEMREREGESWSDRYQKVIDVVFLKLPFLLLSELQHDF